jgi:5-methylcytosine-specific restriction endonuclease McrA
MPEKYVPAALRRQIVASAGGVCEYCRSQARFSPQPFSVEHIMPHAAGGETSLKNLALSCQGCNGHKYTKRESMDPITLQTVPLFHPRQQRWSEHFAWSADATLIVGLTPTGRATVEALHLNRIELVNLREVLCAAQEHPPPESGEDFLLSPSQSEE